MTPKLREGTSIGAFANSSQTMKLAAAVAPISLNSLQVTEKESTVGKRVSVRVQLPDSNQAN